MATIDVKYSPDSEYRYFLYDPEGDGMTFYKTIDERDLEAEAAIDNMLDNGTWSEEVTRIISGEVTHRAMMVEKQEPEGKIDEDGTDEAGTYWQSGVDYMCKYKMLPLGGK